MPVSAPAFPVTRVSRSRLDAVDFNHLPFGEVWSDHMFSARCSHGKWADAEILPYGPIRILPSSKALQYSVALFEGFKAHRTPPGDLAVFRPDRNYERMNRTAARLAMPTVPESMFYEALGELLRLDEAWTPGPEQGSLYIRPSYFGTGASLAVDSGTEFQFLLMTCPVGLYFQPGKRLSLTTTRKYVRAFKGGTGAFKPAGNYGSTLVASAEARSAGWDNVIWLDGYEGRWVEECGVMNMFFVIGGVAVTPPLEGTILPGVTRESALVLLDDLGIPCEERRVSVGELVAAADAGTLQEAFGCGTAATIAPVGKLGLEGREIELPPTGDDSVAHRLRSELLGIQTGTIEDRHGWLVTL